MRFHRISEPGRNSGLYSTHRMGCRLSTLGFRETKVWSFDPPTEWDEFAPVWLVTSLNNTGMSIDLVVDTEVP